MKVTRLNDKDAAAAPFGFRPGTAVAWRRSDGRPDPGMRGVIVGGTCVYGDGRTASEVYDVTLDGSEIVVPASWSDLIRVDP